MKSKPFVALFGLLALVAILGVAPAFGQTANEVDIAVGSGVNEHAACTTTNNCFSPNPITVALGTTVTWKNTDTNTKHTIFSGKISDDNAGSLFQSDIIQPGKTFQFTFSKAGTYDYFDSLYPWMTGQVIVSASTTPNTITPDNATVPEFGPVASIVLAIAVMSMVVFVAKTRGIPKF